MNSLILKLAVLLAALAVGEARGAVLEVGELHAQVTAQRGGRTVTLRPGYQLAPGDRISVGEEGRLALVLGRHGWLDLGSDATLEVERLPFASWAPDLNTVLRLQRGYLRLLWKRPGRAGEWPLRVVVGDSVLALASGEYFFEKLPQSQLVCVGAGKASVTAPGTAAVNLAPGACHRLDRDGSAQPVSGSSLVRARQERSLENIALPAFAALPRSAPAARDAAGPDWGVARATPLRVALVSAVTPPELHAAGPAAAGQWVLTLASHADEALALADAARLQAAGRSGTVEAASVRGQRWHRVRIRGLGSADEAERLGRELASQLGFRDPWVSRE